MNWSLFDGHGQRKYLTPSEREDFVAAAFRAPMHVGSFCLTLAFTGARISEVLALTGDRIDRATGTIVLETLKRRKRGIFRAVPVPTELIELLVLANQPPDSTNRIWEFSRVTAWKYVKTTMYAAGVPSFVARPRALRHAFGIAAVQRHIALSVLKKWLGHAKIETTAVYAEPVGEEERALARLIWPALPTTARFSSHGRVCARLDDFVAKPASIVATTGRGAKSIRSCKSIQELREERTRTKRARALQGLEANARGP